MKGLTSIYTDIHHRATTKTHTRDTRKKTHTKGAYMQTRTHGQRGTRTWVLTVSLIEKALTHTHTRRIRKTRTRAHTCTHTAKLTVTYTNSHVHEHIDTNEKRAYRRTHHKIEFETPALILINCITYLL